MGQWVSSLKQVINQQTVANVFRNFNQKVENLGVIQTKSLFCIIFTCRKWCEYSFYLWPKKYLPAQSQEKKH